MAVNSRAAFRVADVRIIKIPALVLMEQLVFLHTLASCAIKGKRRLQTGFVKNSTGTCFCSGRQQQERARARPPDAASSQSLTLQNPIPNSLFGD
jgi:hypothetical protein